MEAEFCWCFCSLSSSGSGQEDLERGSGGLWSTVLPHICLSSGEGMSQAIQTRALAVMKFTDR